MTVDYDPRRPEVIADPFPVFQELREQAPLYRSSVLGGWVLTRYDDVKTAISDRRFSADRMRPFFWAVARPRANGLRHAARFDFSLGRVSRST